LARKEAGSMTNFYLDVETLPHWDNRPELYPQTDARLTDPEKIRKNQEKSWLDTSKHPEKGCILTLGWRKDPGEVDYAQAIWYPDQANTGSKLKDAVVTEFCVLEDLERLLVGVNQLVSWTDFDIHFVVKRAMKHRMYTLARTIMAMRQVDLHFQWNLRNRTRFTKMRDVAEMLGIETKPDITGKDVYYCYSIGDLKSIDFHLLQDVDLLYRVGVAMGECGLWNPGGGNARPNREEQGQVI
jgi:hypothetical protein